MYVLNRILEVQKQFAQNIVKYVKNPDLINEWKKHMWGEEANLNWKEQTEKKNWF
jgi:hypothetical protein